MSLWRWIAAQVRRVVVLILLVVLVAAGAGWVLAARAAASHVDVSWALDCPAGTLDTSRPEPVIRSRSGWRCDVALEVHNGSSRSLRLLHVNTTILGSGGDGEIRAFSTTDARFHDVGGEDANDVDGVWDVGLTVPAHSARALKLAIGWREEGCNGAGELGLPDWPEVEFRLGGITFARQSGQTLSLRTYDDPHDMVACAD